MSVKEGKQDCPAQEDGSGLLPESQAANYLGLSISTLRSDRLNGGLGIPYFKIGRLVRYEKSELDAWLKQTIASTRRVGNRPAPIRPTMPAESESAGTTVNPAELMAS